MIHNKNNVEKWDFNDPSIIHPMICLELAMVQLGGHLIIESIDPTNIDFARLV